MIRTKSPIRQEISRIRRLLFTYGKVILSGMTIAAIFLFLYTGIRANYVSVALLAALLSTICLGVFLLLLYVRINKKEFEDYLIVLSARKRSGDVQTLSYHGDLYRIADEINALSAYTFRARRKPRTVAIENLLFSTYLLARSVGTMWYYGLTLIKVEFGLSKDPKEV